MSGEKDAEKKVREGLGGGWWREEGGFERERVPKVGLGRGKARGIERLGGGGRWEGGGDDLF